MEERRGVIVEGAGGGSGGLGRGIGGGGRKENGIGIYIRSIPALNSHHLSCPIALIMSLRGFHS